mmetsp:Transcript_17989/g.22539  ORF Transcript_17989/g.22539 Transcript_17989/m.22539 type:complete len:99 (-) Transcript_17989:45-341(-)
MELDIQLEGDTPPPVEVTGPSVAAVLVSEAASTSKLKMKKEPSSEVSKVKAMPLSLESVDEKVELMASPVSKLNITVEKMADCDTEDDEYADLMAMMA